MSIRTFRYTMDNRLQAAGYNGYTHDKQGMRILWNSGGNYTRYEYAPDNRLLQATREWDGTVFEFAHDDQGRRTAKFMNGELVEAYHWRDFIRLAAFHDGMHEFVFIYRSDERTPHAMRRNDGQVFTLHHDQIGSLRAVADQGGNVIQETLYDPFGGIIESANPALRIPLGFAGGLHDRDLGFVRFGWRDYDTYTGRWTAPDPLGDAGGDSDWYGYCLDDPVNGVDPLGLFTGALAPFVRQAAEGTSDFVRNYCDMKEANTIGADKYFHCKANYEASKRGPGGKAAAWGLSELREMYGQMKGTQSLTRKQTRKQTGKDAVPLS